MPQRGDRPNIFVKSVGEIPLLQVSGDLDHLGGPELLEAAHGELGSDGRFLLLDITQCTCIDSARRLAYSAEGLIAAWSGI
jgi:anti-anti-sigma regulatory factor